MENIQEPINTPKKRNNLLKLAGIIVVGLLVVAYVWNTQKDTPSSNLVGGEYAVSGITKAFGANLKMVSLMAPAEEVSTAMDRQYKPFVTPELLAAWKSDPMSAPGRLTSSPYPDRIEIASVSKLSKTSYKVTGNVIEVTNASKGATETASVYPIALTYTNVDGTWLISAMEKGEPEAAKE
jgi:hypothetical protein